jgi:hypothetical protein
MGSTKDCTADSSGKATPRQSHVIFPSKWHRQVLINAVTESCKPKTRVRRNTGMTLQLASAGTGAAPFTILALQRVLVLTFSSILPSPRDENRFTGTVAPTQLPFIEIKSNRAPFAKPANSAAPSNFRVRLLGNSREMLSARTGPYESCLLRTERRAPAGL